MRNLLLPILLLFPLCTWGANKEVNYNNLSSDTLMVNAEKEDTTTAHVLKETVVSAGNVKHYADHDEVLITPKMRRGIGTAFEILEKIQGIRFDKLENSLEVNFSKKIAMQVNGTERSKEYINSIHPDRIKKVEVIYTPAGRYATEGYTAIINLILEENYEGLDVTLRDFSIISPSGDNGNNALVNEQPGFSLFYTKNKWNFNAGYVYGSIHWNYPTSYEKTYTGISSSTSNTYNSKNPNEKNSYWSHAAWGGFDYELRKDQTISFNMEYSYTDEGQNTDYNLQENDLITETSIPKAQNNKSESMKNDWKASLTYRAQIDKKWKIYSNLSYNYYFDHSYNDYKSSTGYNYATAYRNSKDYLKGTFDAICQLNKKTSLNLGGFQTWNRYTSRRHESNIRVSQSTDYRTRLYCYLQYSFNEKLSGRAGLAAEYIHRSNLTQENNNWGILPELRLNYLASSKIQLRGSYTTSMSYPKLYQTSNTSYAVDSLLTHIGNPYLKQSLNHALNITGVFWDHLTIIGEIGFTPHFINTYYTKSEGNYLRTYASSKLFQTNAAISYDFSIGQNFSWSNNVQLSYYNIKYNEAKNHHTSCTFTSSAQYYEPHINLITGLEYNRMMTKSPRLQGYNESGQDYWMLTLGREFFKNKLSLSLMYILPLEWGVRETQNSLTETNFYREATHLNLDTYKNMIFLRATLHLHKGKKTKESKSKSSFDDESRENRGLL